MIEFSVVLLDLKNSDLQQSDLKEPYQNIHSQRGPGPLQIIVFFNRTPLKFIFVKLPSQEKPGS